MGPANQSTPILLVSGFLGSGKTTYLEHLASLLKGRKVAFMVNEFSEQDVDGRRLQELKLDVFPVAGGSVFCRCLAPQFLMQLESLAEENAGYDLIVVETSGIADPGVAQKMLEDARLTDRLYISGVVTIVDPGSYDRYKDSLSVVKRQIRAADLVIINKADVYESETLTRVRDSIMEVAQGVVAIAERAHSDIGPDDIVHQGRLEGEYAVCADPAYARIVVSLEEGIDLHELSVVLRNFGSSIYRAKGFMPYKGGLLRIEFFGDTVYTHVSDGTMNKGFLVVIADPGKVRPLQQQIQDMLERYMQHAI